MNVAQHVLGSSTLGGKSGAMWSFTHAIQLGLSTTNMGWSRGGATGGSEQPQTGRQSPSEALKGHPKKCEKPFIGHGYR